MCNDLTAASNKRHVDGNLWSFTSWICCCRCAGLNCKWWDGEHLLFKCRGRPGSGIHTFVGLEAKLEPPLFPGAHLTHFTCVASQNCSQSLFNQCVRIIQRVSASVSVSVCQTLPFSLCVVQRCISLGYPPQGPNNTTSWWKLGEFFVVMTLLSCAVCSVISLE